MPKDSLRKAAEILNSIDKSKQAAKAQAEKDRQNLIFGIGKSIVDALKPMLGRLVEQSKITRADMERMVSNIKVEANVPEVKVPPIQVPKAEVTVKSPRIEIPDIKMPDKMNVEGFVSLMGVDLNNPLPVQLRDASGKPVNMLENLTTLISGGGGGGGKADFFTIKDIKDSSNASIIDSDTGALKTTASVTLSADYGEGEVGGSTLRVVQATDAIASVNVVSGSAAGTEYTEGDTDTTFDGVIMMAEGGDNDAVGDVARPLQMGGGVSSAAVRVVMATDAIASTNVVSTVGLTDTELRATSLPIAQVSGAIFSTEVTNEVTVDLGTNNDVIVTSVTASTTAIIGDKAADEADGDSNPVKIGGVARTANPTAVAAGDRVSATYDDIGRQVTRPVQVRDLLQTAYVTEDEVGEVTLLAGASGVYHDLVYLTCANSSDAAITIDIRQTTGGTVQQTLAVPANSTSGLALGGATIPQDHADATWTVQNNASDNSNTTYAVTALFSKEV